MVSLLASSAVDSGFESRLGESKDSNSGICCFSAKHAALRIVFIYRNIQRSHEWLVNFQNIFFVKISILLRFTRLFHIARLALNNNHSLHYLFTKHYVLWYFNNLMMFTYLKLSICVSSTLSTLYWILKFQKNQYLDRCIPCSSTCSTKELAITITKIVHAVKGGLLFIILCQSHLVFVVCYP
jgi:hypothetical protein